MVTYAGKVLHSSTTNQYNTVFLKVVALSADVGDYFFAIR
jgi:hypothetical protein